VHVPSRPVADGPDGRRLPVVRSGRRAYHAQVGGEGDAQAAADAQPDGQQQPGAERGAGAQHPVADEHRPEGRGKGKDDPAGPEVQAHHHLSGRGLKTTTSTALRNTATALRTLIITIIILYKLYYILDGMTERRHTRHNNNNNIIVQRLRGVCSQDMALVVFRIIKSAV